MRSHLERYEPISHDDDVNLPPLRNADSSKDAARSDESNDPKSIENSSPLPTFKALAAINFLLPPKRKDSSSPSYIHESETNSKLGSSPLPPRKRYLHDLELEAVTLSPSSERTPKSGNASRLASLRSVASDKSLRTHVSVVSETSVPSQQTETTPSRAPRPGRKAPFMQELDEILEKESISEDERLLLDNYPNLMRCYNTELRQVYRVAEESCCRILANSHLPNLRNIKLGSDGSTANKLTEAFFDAIDSLELDGAQKSENVSPVASVKLKNWFDRYKQKPGEETMIALCMETGISVKVISKWFDDHLVRVSNQQYP